LGCRRREYKHNAIVTKDKPTIIRFSLIITNGPASPGLPNRTREGGDDRLVPYERTLGLAPVGHVFENAFEVAAFPLFVQCDRRPNGSPVSIQRLERE